jgi:two-component system, cell cycle sensor histidine kinase PleC
MAILKRVNVERRPNPTLGEPRPNTIGGQDGICEEPGAEAMADDRYDLAIRRLAHELRTPLAALLTVADVMRSEQFGPLGHAKYSEYAGGLWTSANQALQILSGALESEQAGAIFGPVELGDVDVAALIDSGLSVFSASAEAAGVALSRADECKGLIVRSDAVRLAQIQSNLIANALKFTAAGGQVRIGCRTGADGSAVFEVADTGIGIGRSELAVLAGCTNGVTGRETADAPPDDMCGGGGLGLVLVRSLARECGATFRLESERGKGTCASLVFPPERVVASKS